MDVGCADGEDVGGEEEGESVVCCILREGSIDTSAGSCAGAVVDGGVKICRRVGAVGFAAANRGAGVLARRAARAAGATAGRVLIVVALSVLSCFHAALHAFTSDGVLVAPDYVEL